MKPLMIAGLLSLAASTALADAVATVPTRNQLRALTDTLDFYVALPVTVSGSNASYVPSPVTGTVKDFVCVNQASVSGVTSYISPSIAGVYMGSISATILSTTTVGGVVSGTVTTSNSVVAGDVLRLAISSGLQGAGTLICRFKIEPTLIYY